MAEAKKKKRFFDVDIPLIGKTTQLQGFDKKELNGKIIKYDLTRLLKGKGVILDAKVIVEEDSISTKALGMKIMPYSLKNFVRKGTDYIEDSFVTETTDAKILVKPILITRRKVPKAIRRAIREKAKEEIINYCKSRDSQEIIKDVLTNKFQKPLSIIIKKIYPLSLCEIRVLHVKSFSK